MSQNVFLRDVEYYVRELAPMSQYIEQTSFYIHKMTSRPIDECYDYVKSTVKKKFNEGSMVDPVIHHFERDENGDRHQTAQRLSKYIGTVCVNGYLLAPTGTVYLPPTIKISYNSGFITKNKKLRSVAKKASQAAEAAGNMDLFIEKNNEQVNKKTFNNSMSGAFATQGSVFFNPTGHNTLTSVTRTVSSLGNATNEKIIAGNRHYHNPDVTLNNIICIAQNADVNEIYEVMTKYNLNYPTVEETLACIKYSSDLYWRDFKAFMKIEEFVEKLSIIERAAVVYSSDLYHLRQLNPEFIDRFVSTVAMKVTDRQYDDPISILYKTNEQYVNVAHHICMGFTADKGKDYKTKFSTEELNILAGTCVHIEETIIEYRDFIQAFFLTKVLPASTAHIANMCRRTVVLSDTDSTMFSVDEWVKWKFGEILFTDEAFAYSASIMLFSTQCIAHSLAIFSANMGVEKSKLFLLEMKPEFTFPVFAQTSVAKHYYTCRLAKEGNIYAVPKMEIKGVYLKNSAAPKDLIDASQSHMENLLMSVYTGQKISLLDNVQRVANIERDIWNGVMNADTRFYKLSKIKTPDAYARDETESPYQYHDFWQNTFGPKYGMSEPPPYSTVKIPLTLKSPSVMKRWLDNMEDQELANRIRNWMAQRGKKVMKTFYISINIVQSYGIPPEIQRIIDVKKITLDLTTTDRMILESLGYYPKYDTLVKDCGY